MPRKKTNMSNNKAPSSTRQLSPTEFTTALPPHLLQKKQQQEQEQQEAQQQQQPTDGRPIKHIKTAMDIPRFYTSQAYFYLNHFILMLNEAMKKKKLTDACEVSPIIQRSIQVLEQMRSWLQEYPPQTQASLSRFGNISYRSWFDRLLAESDALQKFVLGDSKYEDWIVIELSCYFKEAFGNRTRIDYGTGHELAFVAWMCCLAK